MRNFITCIGLFLLFSTVNFAQEKILDSLQPTDLSEVIVIGKKSELFQKEPKPLATIDQYLQQSSKINMIRRGSYAWEPMINNMTSERTLITIDGMRIFGACTDKMDPITSYVEVSNLSEATIKSGQEGACHGTTIGGSLDLKRNRSGFLNSGWNAGLHSGFETNNNQKIIGSDLNYSSRSIYSNTDFMFRDADNYSAGNAHEVLYSQFRKFNISTILGFSIDKNKFLEGSFIYDKATNVGYPALPMDVSLAEALITSLKFEYIPLSKRAVSDRVLKSWETKIYFNTISHKMDDTKRLFVPIHMDMPGSSDTYGFYSNVKAVLNMHQIIFDLNSFYNRSVSEMTMYPDNSNEKLMFMYTWPDVRTSYSALFLEDNIVLNSHSSLKFSTSFAHQYNLVASQFGLESLQIFYPDIKADKSRNLSSFSAAYYYNDNGFSYSLGMAYGERAPSVSEAYGFYLFNSFDRFDYIGNPELLNENSIESSASMGYKTHKWSTKIAASYFLICNYIVGKPDMNLIPMTIGASGVKVHTALDYATIFNANLNLEYKISENLNWKGQLVYSYGKDLDGLNLPFISPIRYSSSLYLDQQKYSSEITVQGNAVQSQFSPFYGEDRTPSYAIINFNSGYTFVFEKVKCAVKSGVENILDTYYSTFSDWNNIPRQGRNFFLNVSFNF